MTKMMFELDDRQSEEARAWVDSHYESKHKGQYGGAIGGRFTYTFTQTSIGILAGVKCACGDNICLTNLEEL